MDKDLIRDLIKKGRYPIFTKIGQRPFSPLKSDPMGNGERGIRIHGPRPFSATGFNHRSAHSSRTWSLKQSLIFFLPALSCRKPGISLGLFPKPFAPAPQIQIRNQGTQIHKAASTQLRETKYCIIFRKKKKGADYFSRRPSFVSSQGISAIPIPHYATIGFRNPPTN